MSPGGRASLMNKLCPGTKGLGCLATLVLKILRRRNEATLAYLSCPPGILKLRPTGLLKLRPTDGLKLRPATLVWSLR